MLKLTRKADYGLIALRHLAVKGKPASAKDMAESYGLPLPILSKVLQKLTRAGFLRSEQGSAGGYRLAREAETISALQVIRAIDGPIVLTPCFTDHGECSHTDRCTVREPLRKVHEGILELLSGISIADLSRHEEECRPVVITQSSLAVLTH